jgi:hypothetical protein
MKISEHCFLPREILVRFQRIFMLPSELRTHLRSGQVFRLRALKSHNLLACLPSRIDQWLYKAFVPFTAAGQRENHHNGSLHFPDFQPRNLSACKKLSCYIISIGLFSMAQFKANFVVLFVIPAWRESFCKRRKILAKPE